MKRGNSSCKWEWNFPYTAWRKHTLFPPPYYTWIFNFPIFGIFLRRTFCIHRSVRATTITNRSRNLSIPHPRQSSIVERNERGYPLRITGCKSGITIRSWTSITHAGRNDAQPRSSAPPRILLNVITRQRLPARIYTIDTCAHLST